MKRTLLPYHGHYRPLLLAAAWTGGILLAATGQLAGYQAKAERDAAEVRRQRVEHELRRLQQERDEIQDRAAVFEKLRARGLVGEVELAEWADALRTNGEQVRLPAMKYELQPAAEESTDTGLAFHVTRVKLELQLLHELDLLNYLERLQQDGKALVLVRSCRLTRLQPSPDETRGVTAHLGAHCETDWAKAYDPGRRRS